MSERLTIQQRADPWSNPQKLNYIRGAVLKNVQLRRKIQWDASYRRELTDPVYFYRDSVRLAGVNNVSVQPARQGAENQLDSLVNRLKDPYLQYGVAALVRTWDKIGDYLLTPVESRDPLKTSGWENIYGACGALCLAARFSGQDVQAEFNGVILEGTPVSRPHQLEDTYWEESNTLYRAVTIQRIEA